MKLPALNHVLEYEHPAVLKLYNQNYPNNTLSASCAFLEMKKYLWLAQKHALDRQKNPADPRLPERFFMVRGMQEIDEMWHEFILFTADYMRFCETYFGEYLHHLPNLFDNRPRPRADVERDIAKMLPYIHEHLGEESVRIWFAHYLNVQA
ncbi:hypothetical protein Lgee_0455 [Legionella geestiana]|uniref:Uncharacterized protein n=1 Tax=Legionella geestiana TaxID=45065 RepID=A0A0W0U805_9GAMM|nr:hypothetical protein [Legionella geestiana]KTD03798.1 hypothetical protein Lgee_0455 [Legionella geestiana]QBS11916.1 hypothetical protein E4T54_03675 [Legionella geestiana]QDQ40471.1 hypothetical protein E3226_008750 [Legionella geestiana]STX53371.1 Uncharacterized conserved protein [Legionella geestiana]